MTGTCPQSRGSGQRCSADELHRKSDARRDLCPFSADGLGSGFSLTTRNTSSLRIIGSGSRTRWTAWSQVKRTAGGPRQGCSNIRCSPPAQGRRQSISCCRCPLSPTRGTGVQERCVRAEAGLLSGSGLSGRPSLSARHFGRCSRLTSWPP